MTTPSKPTKTDFRSNLKQIQDNINNCTKLVSELDKATVLPTSNEVDLFFNSLRNYSSVLGQKNMHLIASEFIEKQVAQKTISNISNPSFIKFIDKECSVSAKETLIKEMLSINNVSVLSRLDIIEAISTVLCEGKHPTTPNARAIVVPLLEQYTRFVMKEVTPLLTNSIKDLMVDDKVADVDKAIIGRFMINSVIDISLHPDFICRSTGTVCLFDNSSNGRYVPLASRKIVNTVVPILEKYLPGNDTTAIKRTFSGLIFNDSSSSRWLYSDVINSYELAACSINQNIKSIAEAVCKPYVTRPTIYTKYITKNSDFHNLANKLRQVSHYGAYTGIWRHIFNRMLVKDDVETTRIEELLMSALTVVLASYYNKNDSRPGWYSKRNNGELNTITVNNRTISVDIHSTKEYTERIFGNAVKSFGNVDITDAESVAKASIEINIGGLVAGLTGTQSNISNDNNTMVQLFTSAFNACNNTTLISDGQKKLITMSMLGSLTSDVPSRPETLFQIGLFKRTFCGAKINNFNKSSNNCSNTYWKHINLQPFRTLMTDPNFAKMVNDTFDGFTNESKLKLIGKAFCKKNKDTSLSSSIVTTFCVMQYLGGKVTVSDEVMDEEMKQWIEASDLNAGLMPYKYFDKYCSVFLVDVAMSSTGTKRSRPDKMDDVNHVQNKILSKQLKDNDDVLDMFRSLVGSNINGISERTAGIKSLRDILGRIVLGK